jgi:hypothetical protein
VSRPPRVYTDTNVFGNVMDAAFEPASMLFFEQSLAGKFQLVVSAITSREILYAPERVQDLYESLTEVLK